MTVLQTVALFCPFSYPPWRFYGFNEASLGIVRHGKDKRLISRFDSNSKQDGFLPLGIRLMFCWRMVTSTPWGTGIRNTTVLLL